MVPRSNSLHVGPSQFGNRLRRNSCVAEGEQGDPGAKFAARLRKVSLLEQRIAETPNGRLGQVYQAGDLGRTEFRCRLREAAQHTHTARESGNKKTIFCGLVGHGVESM